VDRFLAPFVLQIRQPGLGKFSHSKTSMIKIESFVHAIGGYFLSIERFLLMIGLAVLQLRQQRLINLTRSV
jgi:hypothetical protein